MSRAATIVPAENDLLCEGCGYTLNGLAISSNCPECGRAIESSVGTGRIPPVWESRRASPGSWLHTTLHVIFRPTHFYQSSTARGDMQLARRFGWICWGLSSVIFALAACVHTNLFTAKTPFMELMSRPGGAIGLCMVVFIASIVTTEFAARLTAWEAAYRGFRLPIDVVKRGLYYHAAHYLPVALLTLTMVLGYAGLIALRASVLEVVEIYLYALCGAVILLAGYLFHTYWIGMRNMMYANR